MHVLLSSSNILKWERDPELTNQLELNKGGSLPFYLMVVIINSQHLCTANTICLTVR